MDVLTFETCWALNSEIIKQVTSSSSIFIQLSNSTNTPNCGRRNVPCGWVERQTDMAKLIVSLFPIPQTRLKIVKMGQNLTVRNLNARRSEREREREREMNEAGARWRRTKNKHSSLRDVLSLSISLSLSLFLTTVELRAARFSTRSSDYHYIRLSTVLSTCNMQTYVQIFIFPSFLHLFT